MFPPLFSLYFSRVLILLAFWGLPLFLFGNTAFSGETPEIRYSSQEGMIDLKAENTPLKNILNSLETVTGVEFFVPRGMNPMVTVELKNVPLERALNQVFRTAFGTAKNHAMVYVAETGADGKTRHVLTEVRLVQGEAPPIVGNSRASSPVSRSKGAPSAASSEVQPGRAPEEIAAKRAEKAAKRAEKVKARSERKAASQGLKGRSSKGPQSPSETTDPSAPKGATSKGNRR